MSQGMQCKYHPETSASWYCQRCDVPFCMSCVPSEGETEIPRCTLCRSYLDPMGISEVITPFWFKLGHFFIYPASPMLLIIAIMIAMLSLLFGPEVSPSGVVRDMSLFSIAVSVGISAFLTKLNFSILEHTAYGNLEQPTWEGLMSTHNRWVFLQFLAIYIALLFIMGLLLEYSVILAVALFIFVVLSWPAMNIILGMSKSISNTLNPVRIVYVISSIGISYILLLLIVLVFLISASFAIGSIESLSSMVTVPIASFVTTYVSFALYHMFGYVVYQYHYELGFSVQRQTIHKNLESHGLQKGNEKSDAASPVPTSNNALVEAEVYVQEGRYEDAERVLTEAVKAGQTDDDIFERLYKLLKLQDKLNLILKLTDKHLAVLHELRAANKMRPVIANALSIDSNYRPKNPEILAVLVKVMSRKDELKNAMKLWNYFRNEHKDYPDLASISFTLAKNITEKLNARKEAKQIIKWALVLASDDLKDSMESYMKLLD